MNRQMHRQERTHNIRPAKLTSGNAAPGSCNKSAATVPPNGGLIASTRSRAKVRSEIRGDLDASRPPGL